MARKDISMTDAEIQAFLASGAKVLIVTSNGADGYPHVAPMWFVLDDGRIVFRSFAKSQKIVNLRRDPKLTVLVETGDSYATLQGVMVKGRAELIDDPEYTLDLYVALAERYPFFPGVGAGATPESDVRAAFERHAAKNTAVVVHPDRVISWDHTKLGGGY